MKCTPVREQQTCLALRSRTGMPYRAASITLFKPSKCVFSYLGREGGDNISGQDKRRSGEKIDSFCTRIAECKSSIRQRHTVQKERANGQFAYNAAMATVE